jgi:hypothetical protein
MSMSLLNQLWRSLRLQKHERGCGYKRTIRQRMDDHDILRAIMDDCVDALRRSWKNCDVTCCFFDEHIRATLLHSAAEYDAADCARWILDCGADVDALNTLNETALMIACRNNARRVFDVLVVGGANLCIVTQRISPGIDYRMAVNLVPGGWSTPFFPYVCGVTFADAAANECELSTVTTRDSAENVETTAPDDYFSGKLPDELLVDILSRCDSRSLIAVAGANRRLRCIAFDRDVVCNVAGRTVGRKYPEYVAGVQSYVMKRQQRDRWRLAIGLAAYSAKRRGGLRKITDAAFTRAVAKQELNTPKHQRLRRRICGTRQCSIM